jgi:hypothetical protein
MQRRVLGKDLVVSAVGLGCMGMTFGYGSVGREQALATVERVWESLEHLRDYPAASRRPRSGGLHVPALLPGTSADCHGEQPPSAHAGDGEADK